MATEVDAVHARFTGDTSNLDEAIRRADGRLGAFRAQLGKVGDGLKNLGIAVGAVSGIAATMGGRMLSAADAIGKAASVAGVTTTQIQTLRFALGQLAGTTDRDVDMALQRFNRGLGLARQGAKEYGDAFSKLNVTLDQDTPQALESAITALGQIENSSDRAAAAAKIFGEEAGPKLAAALASGTTNLEALRKAIQDDGGVISEQSIRNAEAFNDKMDQLSKVVTAELANSMLENGNALDALADAMGRVAGFAGDAVGAFVKFGQMVGAGIGRLVAGPLDPQATEEYFSTFEGGAEKATTAVEKLTQAIENSPIAKQEDFDPDAVSRSGGGAAFAAIEEAAAELEQLRALDLQRLESLQERYKSEEQLLAESKANELATIVQAMENKQIAEQDARALIEQVEADHMDRLAQIRERGLTQLDRVTQSSWDRQASYVANSLAGMTANVAQSNKAMFELNKVAALSAAALDAREAITGAFKVGARIGGPALGAAFAAAAGAAQAANIAAIAGTAYGAGTAPSVGATAAPAVQQVGAQSGGQQAAAPQNNQTLTVRGISPDALFSGESVRVLAEQLIEFQRDGGRVVLQG